MYHFILNELAQVPYDETTTDLVDALYNFRYNEAVAQLRACAGADLAQLVGYFGSDCGVG